MKKILFLTLALLAIVGSARAQHWSYEEGQHPMETFIYADLVLDGETVNSGDVLSQYEVAAFIGDEVRAIGEIYTPQNTPVSIYLLRFRIEGEQADLNKSITFKAFHNNAEYDLEMREEPLPTFTGETLDPGAPSNPRHLYLSEPTQLTMENIVLNVGDEVDLLSKLTFSPEGATVPNTDPVWTIVDTGYFTITDNTLTATAANVNGAWLSVSVGNLGARARVTIYQPATAINQQQTEFTVNVGENVKELLDGCYTLMPETTTDAVEWTWEIGEANPIVNARYNAVNPGDVVFTGTVKGADGIVREVPAPITVTVHVVQPVTGITSQFADGMDFRIEANMGDDLTPYLVDGTAFTVMPATATNKDVTLTIGERSDAGVLTKADDGKITATGEGTGYIEVTAQDGSGQSVVLTVLVHNDVKDFVISQATLNVLLNDETEDISSAVQNNIAFTPSTATEFYNTVGVESNNDKVVTIGDVFTSVTDVPNVLVMATAVGEGTATITVTIATKDYLQATFNSDQDFVSTVSKTFQVVVSQGVSGLDVSVPTLVQFENAEISIMPVPSNATIDMSKLTVTANYVDNEEWNAATIGTFTEGADNTVTCNIEPLIPGYVTFTVTYDNGSADPVVFNSDPQEVGYTFHMPAGWTWQTIPYGYPESAEEGLEGIFGDYLVEIRTQGEQLYNDPQYGFFGDADLLTQNKCFKLKMNSDAGAQSYDFFGGQLGEMEAITLRKGWNWIPNPYIFSRTFENAFADMVFTEGDRIVGQDAFAEYNGNAWEGSLQGLSWSEGYLFFNAGEAGRELVYTSEFDMSGVDDFVEEQPAPSRFKSGAQLPFSYDVRRFRDNMTIVAELDGTADSNRYQVFAFVGDECRGRGISQNGKHFITVHAEAGEQVSFKLYDTLTDQLLGVDQTVQMQQTAGTLKAPMQLTSLAVTTGISNVENASQDGEHFDLGGRNVNASQKGLHIMRQADGTVRKMIRK